MVEASVDSTVQVPPMFHELPDAVEEPRATAVPLLSARSAVSLDVDPPSTSNPVFVLLYAVHRLTVIVPVLPLSVNPSAELPHAMLLLTLWLAAGPVPP